MKKGYGYFFWEKVFTVFVKGCDGAELGSGDIVPLMGIWTRMNSTGGEPFVAIKRGVGERQKLVNSQCQAGYLYHKFLQVT